MPLELARVDPRHKVFHVAGDEEGRVGDDVGPDPDVALLDVAYGLYIVRLTSAVGAELKCKSCRRTSLTVSAILSRQTMTANLLLQNADTVTFFSTSLIFPPPRSWVLPDPSMMPISYSLSSSADSCFARNGSAGGSSESLCDSRRAWPQRRL